jgi:hypothetical protein
VIRRLTLRPGMDGPALVAALNEWMRDVEAAVEEERGYAMRLRATPAVVAGHRAEPWECVVVDASKGAQDVHLPSASRTRGAVIVVVNGSTSANAITLRPSDPADQVDGGSTATIAASRGSMMLLSTGREWVTV